MANFTTTTTSLTDDYEVDFEDAGTVCSLESVRVFLKTFVPLTFSFIFVLGLVGNILVVITFSCYKKTKSMTDIYLLNMSIADILLIFTLPFWAAYYYNEWIFKDFMCKLVRSIYAINFNCSMLLLACVGIDRYVAIVQVTKSFSFRTVALAYKRVLCISLWIISVILSTITFIFSASFPHNGKLVCEARYPANQEAFRWKLAVLSVEVSVGFLIPLLVMIFCYVSIVKTLLQAKNSQRHKAINVVVSVVLIFLVCQLPYNVLLLRRAATLGDQKPTCHERINDSYAFFITKTLAYFHCCLNPVIYAFIGVKFRNYFFKIIQDLWCFKNMFNPRTHWSRASSDMFSSRKTSEVSASEGGSSFTM
ncbi:C-C chemokine receptor type 6 [Hyla sarda]|uniref:C-C chemokine receptor type 6 n=1 Tax=Hyla sarda TaxID=327740 RepID=UPI0024C2CF35|nr:C-C chemokine receptor type 6 [Hyla sarda]XP_056422927.1 C-C chemokine receptor type 6 [Hyla sarda]XP_056422928.1 C-C chemokine receptor type 6 [Hyla sarda]XP_056422929.1 C-C chemokine receptor type 6 [Hyla sarda]XP_056422930.1 C-C chemokine receptor type 6 [Hyla sarda]XP_056422931.1 C-C chemokine receptor type 6 [Hyla sarda]